MNNDDLDPSLTNAQWTLNQIHKAKTQEDLDQIQMDIKADQFHGDPYTKCAATMARIRKQFNLQQKKLNA